MNKKNKSSKVKRKKKIIIIDQIDELYKIINKVQINNKVIKIQINNEDLISMAENIMKDSDLNVEKEGNFFSLTAKRSIYEDKSSEDLEDMFFKE